MIKFENIYTMGFEPAIRGMRNPMNSWSKSDSDFFDSMDSCSNCPWWKSNDRSYCNWGFSCPDEYIIGPNDLNLAKKLVKGGPVHAKFRRMITVWLDITAPLYWWKEFDTYKVGTVANSCSTMHKIHSKEFTLDDFSCEHLFDYNLVKVNLPTGDSGNFRIITNRQWLLFTCELLNSMREAYLETKDKDFWWQIIQLLPSSYNQKRTVMLNYEVLSHIYHDRKGHKLDEWHDFCEMIENLPYAKELIIGEELEAFEQS